jgi:hypothetical protein
MHNVVVPSLSPALNSSPMRMAPLTTVICVRGVSGCGLLRWVAVGCFVVLTARNLYVAPQDVAEVAEAGSRVGCTAEG